MITKQQINRGVEMIKILKHGIKVDGKYIPCFYSKGGSLKYSESTIRISCKSLLDSLPEELNPKNNSDMQVDYFEKDRAYIEINNPRYKDFLNRVEELSK